MVMPYSTPAVKLSSSTPMGEVTSPTAGSGTTATRSDHAHPRLSSAHVVTLDANGQASITFTRTFAQKPAFIPGIEDAAANQPVLLKVISGSWTQDVSNNYTGCKVQGQRAQVIPQNLATLLLSAVFNVFGGATPAGVTVSAVFLQVS